MSLTLYWNREDVPQDVEFITDNNSYFVEYTLHKLDKTVDKLLTMLDKAKYLDKRRFLDKFDTGVYWLNLSTGGKTVLNIYYSSDKCFSTIECGRNALDSILKLDRGQVQMQYARQVPGKDDYCDIIFDGEIFTSLKELEEW